MEEMKPIIVPKFDELAVALILDQVKDDNEIMKYFPDNISHKKIDWGFFFNILHTLRPEYVKGIIERANNFRNKPEENEEKKQFILVSDNWLDKLLEHPFISSMIS